MTAPPTAHSLDAIFAPASIAVIGASERPGSVGRAIAENLASFGGRVFLVNREHRIVLRKPAVPSVGAIKARLDLAVIATPAATVPRVVRECADARVPAAVIISAGFKESGEAGAAIEREVLATARAAGMRVVGPNCLGVMNPHTGLNATFAAGIARPGSVAFISQSGALCTAVLDWSLRENVGFSAFVSIGSMADVGWGDLIDHFADDPRTKSIVCYMESVGDARAFLSAARAVSFTKPIIVIKVGHTEAAAKAAASHTGSMTGSDAVLDAAFRRVGVLRVGKIEELFDMAEVLAKQPRPRGPRLAIVTNAGGPGALATDMLVTSGGQLALLSAETRTALGKLLPAAWSHGNPVDILGAADADLYERSVKIVANDPGTDGVLVILTPQAMTDANGTAHCLARLAKSSGKPVLASWMGGASLDTARATLNAAGIPTFDYPDRAARAFALMWQYSDHIRLLYERPALPRVAVTGKVDRRKAARCTDSARKAGRTLLTEAESKALLADYGIPTVETRVAGTEREAVQRAAKLGYPVVLKLHSETLTHKTDVGGVKLDLRNATAVRAAWRAIRKGAGDEHFGGVTVQPFIQGKGIELILGSAIDPQFGPVLLFGAGGTLVEALQDRAIGLPPLTATLARRMMERTRIFRVLCATRGGRAVDIGALAELLVRFSHMVAEQRTVAEIDINPLLASPDGFLALDARIVLHAKDDELPRLAIRPYPAEYISRTKLRDGSRITLRPIRPEDEDALITFHAAVSEQSVYFRYFSALPLRTRTAHERLARVCFADYDREMAIVAAHGREIAGVARINRLRGRSEAEFAVLVADAWQGRGLGRQLLEKLIAVGRAEKLSRITGVIHPANAAMLHVCRAAGFHVRRDADGPEFTAEFAYA